ncbi:3-hydroxyisobutyryl-CoA hydrolase, mitochondrial precursor, putative [Eimeria necatrix]|uniref:3-hydroxyisobutyryl-CoA hydrolase n=1 Tax=Eimeria necatrix TaxID=51315 RepID=U6MIX3_9EIME|nr:3-hydroxyisobutyryl-CoA hydrolase, mitochondrial precursor, putative [Eimeria necatrix]CDJ62419.1 3-hydroxyisobutyryl-CoA hydrolase, mitochondrial precursor, putative [Eimeria necatrix]
MRTLCVPFGASASRTSGSSGFSAAPTAMSSQLRQLLQQQPLLLQQQQQQMQKQLQKLQSYLPHFTAGRLMSTSSTDSSSMNSIGSISRRGSNCSRVVSLAGGELILEEHWGSQSVHPVFTLTLNRPSTLNAVSHDVLEQLLLFFKQKQPQKGLTLLRGQGDKAFCAGGDVRALAAGDREFTISFFCKEYQLDFLLAQQKGPTVVSLWDGIVFGGGVGLSVHGGLRVCTEKTLFAMPEVYIGVIPDAGLTQTFAELKPRGLGLFLALTGERLRAADLMDTGLATHYLPSTRLPAAISRLQQGVPLGADPTCWASQVLEEAGKVDPEGPLETPPSSDRLLQPHMLEFLERFFAHAESLQSLMANLKENSGDCSLCRKTLESLQRACPLSLVVAFKAIRDREHATAAAEATATAANAAEAKAASEAVQGDPAARPEEKQKHQQQREIQKRQRLQLLQDALEIELVLMCNMTAVSNSNFVEGVRALLVDKDKKPKWQPSCVSGVSQAAVTALFKWEGQRSLARL